MAGHLKRRRRSCDPDADLDSLLANLESPDELLRAKSLLQLCPCHSWHRYEQRMDVVRRLRKDPSPVVRDVATHIEHEIIEIESIERWVARAADEGLPHRDRDFVRRRLEMRRQRPGYSANRASGTLLRRAALPAVVVRSRGPDARMPGADSRPAWYRGGFWQSAPKKGCDDYGSDLSPERG